ncbi:hypothetical protein Tco_0708706 [Tanacetum coccineum]
MQQMQTSQNLPDDTLDYMDTEDAQDVGRTRDVVNEEKEIADDKVSTKDALSTAQQKVSTNKEKVSTDRPSVSTDRPKVNTDKEKDSTVSPDEGTVDQTEVLLNMSQAKAVSREKEKGVEIKDVEETKRPRPTSTRSLLTLKPLPKIDPKDKGKKKIKDEDDLIQEYEGIPMLKRSLSTLLGIRDGSKDKDESSSFTVEERAKILLDTMPSKKGFLAEQIAIAIRNKTSYKNSVKESNDDLFETLKRFDESFTAVGSTKDERRIKEMNEGVNNPDQKSLKKMVAKETSKKEDTSKVPAKVDVTEQGTMDSEIMERKFIIARLNNVSSPDGDYLVIYRANGNFRAFNCLLEDNDLNPTEENDQETLKMGPVIHMLVERRYPLSKDLLQRMLDLGLEVERESTVALDLIRFIKQQIGEE